MHSSTLKRTGWLAATLLTLLTGCKKSNDTVTPANQECQLQSDLTVISNGSRSATTYTYNGNGQLTSSVVSSSLNGVSTGISATNTYVYDAAGNLTTTTAQESGSTSTTTYEYTGGRLIKESSQQAGTLLESSAYSYDGSGRVATYTTIDYAYSQPITESYTFTSGVLTGGSVTSGSLSATVTTANGRIASQSYPGGARYRYTYDASGYLTRVDELNAASVVQSYEAYEYGTTAYKTATVPPVNRPAINLYGTTGFPLTRQASYTSASVLTREVRYQYQVNSRGFLTSEVIDLNPTTTGKLTGTFTYAYGNCQ